MMMQFNCLNIKISINCYDDIMTIKTIVIEEILNRKNFSQI